MTSCGGCRRWSWTGTPPSASPGAYAGAVGWTPTGGVISQIGPSVTGVASLLAPPPPPRPRTGWYVWIVVLVTYCLCWADAGITAGPDTPTDARSRIAAVVAPSVVAAPVLLALVVAGLVRLIRKDRTRRAVGPYVAALYQQAWYYGRRVGVLFPPGTALAHMLTGGLIPVAAFRAPPGSPATAAG